MIMQRRVGCLARRGRNDKCHRLPGHYFMLGRCEFDQDFVRAGGEAVDDDRAIVAGVGPPPRQVIDADVEMPGAGRYVDRCRTEDPPLAEKRDGHLAACWEIPDAA